MTRSAILLTFFCLAALALPASPSSLAAQIARCVPTSAPERVARKVVHLNLRPAGEHVRLPLGKPERDRLGLMLQFVQERFVAPTSAILQPTVGDLLQSSEHEVSALYSPRVEGMIVFRAHSNGRISDLRLLRSSGAEALDSAVLGAVTVSDQEDDLGMLGFDFAGDSTDHVLRSADFVLSIATQPDSLAATHPLAMLNVGLYVIRQAIVAPDNEPPPYPQELANDGREGEVVVRFIVDTEGRAEMDSIRVFESNDPAFTRAVRRHLPNLRYLPAEVGGCRMRMWVVQPFTFKMARRASEMREPPPSILRPPPLHR